MAALTAEERAELAQLRESSDPETQARIDAALGAPQDDGAAAYEPPDPGGDLVSLLDPDQPLQPQALAVQPSTTHPGGDEAAADEWVRGDLDNPAGVVVVYDAPLQVVRQKLAENPRLLDAVGMSISPGSEGTITKGSATEQAFQDFHWREAADAAAKAGKTVYRYSKAPWLGDGKGASVLSSLSTKLGASVQPATDTATAFVLGVDELANFGLGRSGAERMEETIRKDIPGFTSAGHAAGVFSNDETVGGGAALPEDATLRERHAMVEAEHPTAKLAGQVTGAAPELVGGAAKLGAKGVAGVAKAGAGAAEGVASKLGATATRAGKALSGAVESGATAVTGAVEQGVKALSHWNPANSLWEFIVGTKVPATAGGTLLQGAGRAGAASAASQGVTEASRAADSYQRTGTPGTTLEEAAERVKNAGEAGLVLGTLGAIPQAGARGLGNWVREGARYNQLPGRVERLGSEPKLGRGHVDPPAVAEARVTAKARDVKPVDVLAEKLDKPLAAAAKKHEAGERLATGQESRAFHATPEGQAGLPVTETVQTTLDKLRERTSKTRSGKKLQSVGVPNAERPVRGIFNTNIDGVSVHPTPGAIELTPDDAEAFLHPVHQRNALRSIKGKKPVRANQSEQAAVQAEYADVLDMRIASKPEAAAAKAPKPAATAPGSFAKRLRAAGVKTVYVLPREYNAQHTQTVIRQLQRRGKDSPNDRDLGDIYHAALRDRDARPMNGKPGGWSEAKQAQEKRIAAAKDTRKEVGPNGAYAAVHGNAVQAPGQSKTLQALEDTAARAGGNSLELLRGSRVIDPLDRLRARGAFGTSRSGQERSMLSPNAWFDAMTLRGAYPLSRTLENLSPLGGLLSRGGQIYRNDHRDDAKKSSGTAAAKMKRARERAAKRQRSSASK